MKEMKVWRGDAERRGGVERSCGEEGRGEEEMKWRGIFR